ncbi:Hypothetical_protein [Hexamita inflata]|uniref:Hypothetical_protein n=1 Tax=Hexamita inflata TaxID=28002 RepID=A0AA86P5M6_9EUKA|nr:Hypothetical protein HINF_LOCUS20307 [Hexamita inflata]
MPVSKISQSTAFQQICSHQLLRNGQSFQYCLKEYSLSSRVQTSSVNFSPLNAVHYALYTTATQNFELDLTYSMQNLPSFALFGLTSVISIQNSNISVKIPQQLSYGSLLCLSCDVSAKVSDFSFIASGQIVSGAVFSPKNIFELNQSLIQFRLGAENLGGLILNASNITVSLSACNISGFASQLTVSGSVICFTFEMELRVDNVRVCSNIQYNIGQGVHFQTGDFVDSCIICRLGRYTYGLCYQSLEFGQIENEKFVCQDTFIYDGERCLCVDGEVLNGTTCVNLLTSINLLITQQTVINNSIIDFTNKTKTFENLSGILNNSQIQMNIDIQNLYLLSNLTQSHIIANSTQLQEHILQNYTIIEFNLQANTSTLDQRIFNNISILRSQVQTLNTSSIAINQNITQLNQTLSNQTALNQLLIQNISQLNQTLASENNLIKEQQKLINNLILFVECLNSASVYNLTGQCQAVNNNQEPLHCNQLFYLYQFDIAASTHQVLSSSNFSDGYVFNTATVIKNAFIDVSNDVYSAIINPLFETQNSFINLKIQFGTQVLSSGQLIFSQISSITVNQMNIISKSGCQITVNSNQLNIITNSPSSAVINNLLVNLSFTVSCSGNITLINNIQGAFNISNYQVLGDYISSLQVAMIGLNIKSATVNVNQVSFKPNSFNVGNFSSYLFGSSVQNFVNVLMIDNLAVFIGSSSIFQLMGSVTTNQNNYYLFGGIIACVNSVSLVSVSNVIIDSYQKFSTDYVCYSGFLFGRVESDAGKITITSICLQQKMTSTALEFSCFGFVGDNSGKISIQNASVIFSAQGLYFNGFGIIGQQPATEVYVQVINLRASVSVSSGVAMSPIFGYEAAKNCSIVNANVIFIVLAPGSNYTGGMIGYQHNNATIMNSSVQDSNVSGQNYIGGILSHQYIGANTTLINTTLLSVNISGSDSVGGIIGVCKSNLNLVNILIQSVRLTGYSSSFGLVVGVDQSGTYSFATSTAVSNFIKDILQNNCPILLSTQPITGC